jgi:hypothetical protein
MHIKFLIIRKCLDCCCLTGLLYTELGKVTCDRPGTSGAGSQRLFSDAEGTLPPCKRHCSGSLFGHYKRNSFLAGM